MDEQIYLDPNAPPEPAARRPGDPRQRMAVLLALVLVIGAVIAIQHSRHPASTPSPVPAPTPAPVAQLLPWPQGHGVCGTELELPMVTSAPLTERTDASVLLTGALPGRADVDLGSLDPIPGLDLADDEYVSQLITVGRTTYSLVRSCANRAVGTAVRTDIGGGPRQVIAAGLYGLLADGHGAVWGERHRARPEAAIGTTLLRLDKAASAIALPSNLNPIGVAADHVVATGDPLPGSPAESPLYTYDLQSKRTALVGNSFSVLVSNGAMLWNSSACSDTGPCTLHILDLSTLVSTVRDYHLPLESSFGGGVLSPDHRKLAYVLPRETTDGSYRSSNTEATPSDLVVLDLGSGIVDPIPNLELAPKATPAELQFTADGKFLLIGLAADAATMLLAWRSGQNKPMLSREG